MRGNKGQLAIYIVIGIMVLVLIALMLYTGQERSPVPADKASDISSSNYRDSLEELFKSCISDLLTDSLSTYGLDEGSLETYLRSRARFCIDGGLARLTEEGVSVEKEEYSLSLEISAEAIIVAIDYPLRLEYQGKVERWSEGFIYSLPLEVRHKVSVDPQTCQSLSHQSFHSSDMNTVVTIPEETVMKDPEGGCLEEFSIRMGPTNSPLSVFKINYDFLPNGATFDPYFEVVMRYNQADFERVRAAYLEKGYAFEEDEIRIAFFDEEGDVLRPYDQFPQVVDIGNNKVYGKPQHFTWIYTLAGCNGDKTHRYYEAHLYPVEAPLNTAGGCLKGAPDPANCQQYLDAGANSELYGGSCVDNACSRFTCDGKSVDNLIGWFVPDGLSSCLSKDVAVEVYVAVSDTDNYDFTDGYNADTIKKLTTVGWHQVPGKTTDADGCYEHEYAGEFEIPGGYGIVNEYEGSCKAVCAFAKAFIRITGFGVEEVSNRLLEPGEEQKLWTKYATVFGMSGEEVKNGTWFNPLYTSKGYHGCASCRAGGGHGVNPVGACPGTDSIAAAVPMEGQMMVDPEHPQWFVYNRDSDGDGKKDPYYLAGLGDPEDFLFNRDQNAIIGQMKAYGGNGIYMHALMTHGGDGKYFSDGGTFNPFVDGDPSRGFDEAKLAKWEDWFTAFDEAGIVVFLFFYDDEAKPWGDTHTLTAQECSYIQGLVQKFKHHKHIVWVIGEEYGEAMSVERAKGIAAAIRAVDNYGHPIGIHKNHGLDFSEFADDPYIDQHLIQYNEKSADELHDSMKSVYNGKYGLNLAESGDSNCKVADSVKPGSNKATYCTGDRMRRKNWAVAMGGAYVMVYTANEWVFSNQDLKYLRIQQEFFENTDFNTMTPRDDLRAGDAKYVLANSGVSAIAYGEGGGSLGVKGFSGGSCNLFWVDTASGETARQDGVECQESYTKPGSIGSEAAVWIRKV